MKNVFSLMNFFIVLAFNIYWMRNGFDDYFYIFNVRENGWMSLLLWFFAMWGIFNLVYFVFYGN